MKKPFVVCALLASLCGCGSPNPTPSQAQPWASDAQPNGERKLPKAVVLVSDSGTNEVLMLAYPRGTLLKTLGDFSEPEGICSDDAGHFWITNTGDSDVLEYSTAGTLLNTLTDSNNYPVGCAYDPSTGNLAVVNVVTTGDGPGSVAIYGRAKGLPTIYSGGGLHRVYFGAFDGSTGTLVVAGEDASYSVALATLKGGKFKEITLKGVGLAFPGNLAWSDTTHSMNIADQDNSTIYRFDLNGTITGSTVLDCDCSITPYAIFGGKVLTFGPSPTSNGNQGLDTFDYPAGGAPTHFISQQFSEPIGISISNAVTE